MSPELEPFEISAPDEALQDLALRLRATRLPTDAADAWDAGISPAYLREVVAYWRDRFDWRAQERALNRFRQFRVEVDGTRVHLIHEPGRGPAPLPLLLTHGYPDSPGRTLRRAGAAGESGGGGEGVL